MLDGGPTLNPSTYDLLAAIHAIPAEEVVVLPNSPNVIMAAERAAELSDKTVSRRALALAAGRAGRRGQPRSRRGAEENADAMARTLERVRTGAVAPAARDDAQGRFREGDAVGFVEEEIVVWGAPARALRGVLERLRRGRRADHLPARRRRAAATTRRSPALAAGEVEFELSDGGQPSYWWLLSAE